MVCEAHFVFFDNGKDQEMSVLLLFSKMLMQYVVPVVEACLLGYKAKGIFSLFF